MVTEKQLAANRKNAQRSTGPRTRQGKEASRLNALTHGMRAVEFDVLPIEDADEFAARVDGYFRYYRPTNIVEEGLVEYAAVLSWRALRSRRYEKNAITRLIELAIAGAEQARLDRETEAACQLLPSGEEVRQSGFRGDDAGKLVEVLKRSADGCSWLLSRWDRLRASAKREQFWIPEYEMHAIRLLGGGPGQIDDPEIADMVVANRVLMAPGVLLDPFAVLDAPLGMKFVYGLRQEALLRQPRDPASARAVILALADREIASLEALLAERERDGDLGLEAVEMAGWLATFDASVEGQRLRQYQAATNRELLRTLDALAKLRREESRRAREESKMGPICPNEADLVPEPPVGRVVHADIDNEPIDGEICANEPNCAADVQVMFASEREISVESADPTPPTAAERHEHRQNRPSARKLINDHRSKRRRDGK